MSFLVNMPGPLASFQLGHHIRLVIDEILEIRPNVTNIHRNSFYTFAWNNISKGCLFSEELVSLR